MEHKKAKKKPQEGQKKEAKMTLEKAKSFFFFNSCWQYLSSKKTNKNLDLWIGNVC